MELFKQRMVNIKITISWEEKNSRNNEMSVDVDVLSDMALKNIYDELYWNIYRLNQNLQDTVEDTEHAEEKPTDNTEREINVDDIPF